MLLVKRVVKTLFLISLCQYLVVGYDAFFHGTIKLWCFHYWYLMGAALELVVLPTILPLTYKLFA